jgi:DNA-binding GntR family transcriptional regulator
MIYQRVGQKSLGARVHNESLAEQVYQVLRESIATGRLRPGERIVEKPLAKQLEVSRTPVREALLKLGRDGLVICNSRRRYKVRVLSVADVKKIYATLGILESAVVGMASTRAPANRAVDEIIGDWQLSSVLTHRDGFPFDVSYSLFC